MIYMFIIPSTYIPTLCTVVIMGAGYWATTRLAAFRFNVMARASRPGDQRESVDDLAWDLAVR